MSSSRSKWIRGMGVVVLVGGFMITGWGLGVTSAAPPASNLDNHTQRWDTHNPSASRFATAFTGAVLDKNTGLVWEQAPDATKRTWATVTGYCINRTVGGTVGWRLPSVVELKSLQDPSLAAPLVPASVFTGVQSADYWSASSAAGNPATAWVVSFLDGFAVTNGKTDTIRVWCVRGPMQESAY
jgi:hypothetical protein